MENGKEKRSKGVSFGVKIPTPFEFSHQRYHHNNKEEPTEP